MHPRGDREPAAEWVRHPMRVPPSGRRLAASTQDRDQVIAAAMAALAPTAPVFPLGPRHGRAINAPDGPRDAGEPGPETLAHLGICWERVTGIEPA